MKTMVLRAPEELVQEDVESPTLREGKTLVRITHSGVCGTDLKIYQGQIPVDYPRIMGHEMIGEVVEVGDAQGVEIGARVIIDPVIYCGRCHHCLTGQQNLCPEGSLMGRDCDGGFSEYMLAPSDAVFPLPDNIPGSCAPLLQVMTTCLHAQRLVQIFPNEAVVVIGLGVSGQLHVQLARARGAYPIIGISGSPVRRSVAEEFGADFTLASGDDVPEKVRALTNGRGADLVIESAGAAATLAQAIDLARLGGRLLLFGIHVEKEAALPLYQFYFKELAIFNSRAAKREDYPACISLVSSGQIELESLISHELPLNKLQTAISMLGERDEQRLKVILNHS
jgi:2-desacetyl-2-hydroxyethyl bacteriochlorophyllide A dehydrogenase